MKEEIKTAGQRILRSAGAIAIAAGLSIIQKDPKLIWLAPVLQGLSKFLRDKWGIKYIPF